MTTPARQTSRRPIFAALLWTVFSAAGGGTLAAETPAYVGSTGCAGCHESETEAWSRSHHALAWTEPTEGNVLGDFDDAVFEHGGVTTRFSRDGDDYVVETERADGIRRQYKVVGVAGIAPLQQYLLSPELGRTQAFDVAWDVEGHRWYPLFPDQQLQPNDGFHWTGPYKSWEARCAECHATGYTRNYDAASRSYTPRLSEIGVGCEACHGPGEAHVAWAETQENHAPRWPDLTEHGFTVDMAADAETQIQQCAGCHSRREAFGDGNPTPGTPYHDAYSLALLRGGLYHADGSIHDEVYVYGSFLQSKMYARGVRCSDCHEPHAAALVAEGNAVCTQCHSPAGNDRFPTLRKTVYDDPVHHFHTPGTSGAECKSCHMIERVYMGIDGRRDHSFRVPRPDLADTGAPSACIDCHDDRDAGWAAAEIASRFPDSSHRGPHFATVFAGARPEPAAETDRLIELASLDDTAGIVRATALDLLVPVADPKIAERTLPMLGDGDPLVRAAAAALQRGAPAPERLQRLLPALQDPVRAVRIAAAKALLDTPPAPPSDATAALQAAMSEYRAALMSRTDFPETHLQIGGAGLAMRNLRLAEPAFREAVALDPQLVDGWMMIIRLRAAVGDTTGARAALMEALSANPTDPNLLVLRPEIESAPGR